MTHDPHAHREILLSTEGLARKRAMLDDLQATVRRRGHRRTAARAAAGVASVALVVTGAVVAARSGGTAPTHTTPTPAPTIAHNEPTPETHNPSAPSPTPAADDTPTPTTPRILYVRNDPTALERYAAPKVPTRVELLTDSELLAALKANGMPAGMIKTDNRVRLAFHNVPPAGDNRTP